MPLNQHARLIWATCVVTYALAVAATVPFVIAQSRGLVAERQAQLDLVAALLADAPSQVDRLASAAATENGALRVLLARSDDEASPHADALKSAASAPRPAVIPIRDPDFSGFAIKLPEKRPEGDDVLVVGTSIVDLDHDANRRLVFVMIVLAGAIASLGAVALLIQQRIDRSMFGRLRGLAQHIRQLTDQREALNARERKIEGEKRMMENEIRRQTEVLLRAQENLMQTERLAAVGKLAAGVAHEINNPLATIAAYAEDARSQFASRPSEQNGAGEVGAALTIIEAQAYRCKQTIDKLLAFAREAELHIEWRSLASVVEDAVTLESLRARKAGVEIVVRELAEREIRTDPVHLEQVLVNLLDNAVDASGGHGQVEVSVTIVGDLARITVSDHGAGIPEAIRSRIFNPFFTTKPVGSGTGMGLSICYGIVTKLRGHIGFESVEGQGTTFAVELPLDAMPLELLSETTSAVEGAA